MRFEAFSFSSIRIDGITYEHDVVIDQGQVRKRKKKPSKSSATNSDTLRSRRRKKSPGRAGGSLSAPELAPSR
jgi:hypothetical protein